MLLRFEGGDFKDLLKNNERFILHVFFKEQAKLKTEAYLNISPSFSNVAESANQHVKVMKSFPDALFVETFHHESYDLVNNFGFNYGELWDDFNSHYRPLIIGVKKGRMVSNSLGECYCIDTYMSILHSVYPELFEPPSVSES